MYKRPEFHDTLENNDIEKNNELTGDATPKAVIVVFLVAAVVYTVWAAAVLSTAAAIHITGFAATYFTAN